MPVPAPRVGGGVEMSVWRLSHEASETDCVVSVCLCLCVCIVMSQKVKPCEDSNIHWGYITLMGEERWRGRMRREKKSAAQ